ncbi:hypothetical protein JHK87_024184 [Glycine soja]|nr:hypothetical protein JHK87_024184 [Glycine soja]
MLLPVVVPFDLLPPPQVMKEKLAPQHAEMQCLATENQRLAATYSVLRQELAVAQHEMQMLHGHMVALKREREQQIRAQLEKIVKMESEAQGSESVKIELKVLVTSHSADLSIVPFLLPSRVVIQAFTLVGQPDLGLKKPSKMESATTRE